MRYESYLLSAIESSVAAGKAIMDIYQSDFSVEMKDDKSPLTMADKRSHNIIKNELAHYKIPFISEEGKQIPFNVRKEWSRVWIVDPLDGTKEFIKRNGEFTVNVALVENTSPVLGVVYAPVPQLLYFASIEIGAYKLSHVMPGSMNIGGRTDRERMVSLTSQGLKLPVDRGSDIYKIVGSRSHGTTKLENFIEKKRQDLGNIQFIVAGSSIKICLVAEGAADIYPRLGPTMEWDTAAGHSIAMCSGAEMNIFDSKQELKYNKEQLLNPWFIVERPQKQCIRL